jgi:hypothetical protein
MSVFSLPQPDFTSEDFRHLSWWSIGDKLCRGRHFLGIRGHFALKMGFLVEVGPETLSLPEPRGPSGQK